MSVIQEKGMDSLPLPTLVEPKRAGNKLNKSLLIGALALSLVVYIKNPLQAVQRSHLTLEDQSLLKEAQCPFQPQGKLAASSLWPSDGLSQEEKLEYAYKLSKAVQIPTESFDDLGRDTDPEDENPDPRWAVHGVFNTFLEEEYLLTFKHLQYERVHKYSHLFTLPGTNPSLKPIMLMGHQDVVPVPEATVSRWTYPPFSGKITKDGWIWGRGSVDNKNTLISVLSAMERVVKERLGAGEDVRGERTVILSFGFDEEMMGPKGAGDISQILKKRYGPDGIAFIIDEGFTGIDVEYGLKVASLGMSEKGGLGMQLVVETPGGHASMPPKHTGLGVLSLLLARLEANPSPPHFTSTSPLLKYYQCLASYAPEIPADIKKKALDPSKWDDLAMELSEVSDKLRAYTATTLAINIVNGGVKSNALPEISTATLDSRIGFDDTVAAAQERFSALLTPIAKSLGLSYTAFGETRYAPSNSSVYRGDISLGLSGSFSGREAAAITKSEGAVWDLLASTIKGVWGESVVVSPSSMIAGTDTKWMAELSENVIRWLPASFAEARNPHTVDESITIDAHVSSIRFFYELIRGTDGWTY